MRPGQIPYGVKDFKRIRLENRYYADKAAYIRSDWSKLKTILDAQHVAEQRDGILPLTQELADSEEVQFPIGGEGLACIETVA